MNMSGQSHRPGRVVPRAALWALSGWALSLLWVLGACGGRQEPQEHAELRMEIAPPTASVYVDERFLATGRKLASRPARLPVGVHFITVSAPGYFPHDVRVDLPQGETKIELSLRPVPP